MKIAVVVLLLLHALRGDAQAQSTTEPPVRFTFYGVIIGNLAVSDGALSPSDIPTYALPSDARVTLPPIGGQPIGVTDAAGDVTAIELTARQTRVGVRVALPAQGGWTPAAQIEVDFLGARVASGQGTTYNQVRMRLAYASIRHTSGWTLGGGQNWTLFAPLNPTSYAHYAIPLAASAGNAWMRLPQIRLERTFAMDGDARVDLQAAVLRPVGGADAPAAGSLGDTPPLAGERSGQPFYQARVGAARRQLAAGVSVHYGGEDTGPDVVPTWGIAGDVVIPLAARASISGELWTGSNLDTFQAGIGQGVVRRGTTFEAVDASGGWAQVSVPFAGRFTALAGGGVDNPSDDDLGAPVERARNQVWWAGLNTQLHPNVLVAAQYNRFDTTYRSAPGAAERAGRGHHVNLALVCTF